MKAALLVRPGQIEIEDVPEPEVGPDEVAIAVGGVGLCGSDLSVFSGAWAAPSYPWVMGHEAFGTIDSVGPGVDPGRIGQTVVVEPNVACLTCAQCRPRVDFGLCGTAVRRDEPSGGARRAARRPGAIRMADSWRFADRPRLRRADGGRDGRAATYRFTPPRVGPGGRSRCPGPADVSCSPRSRRRRPCSRGEPGARRTRDSAGRHRRVGRMTSSASTSSLTPSARRGPPTPRSGTSRLAGRCSSLASTTTRGRSMPRRSSGARPSCGAR